MKNYKTLTALAALTGLSLCSSVHAATLVSFFDGNYTTDSLVGSAKNIHADVTSTDMSRVIFGGDPGGSGGSMRNSYGPSFVGTGNNFYLVYNGDNASDTLSEDAYLQFQVTADAGLLLDLNSITLDWAWAANAAGNWDSSLDIQTSTDGSSFSTVAGSLTTRNTGDVVQGNTDYFTGGQGLSIDMSSLANAASYTIRIRSADTSTSNSHATSLFQNITLDGAVTAVPESSAALLIGLAGLALLRRRRS